jgi:hypothetical protein
VEKLKTVLVLSKKLKHESAMFQMRELGQYCWTNGIMAQNIFASAKW